MPLLSNRRRLGALFIAAFLSWSSGPSELRALQSTVDNWRVQNERAILAELFALLSIPNVSPDDTNMRRNAELLSEMFTRRGFTVEQTEGPGAPLVVAQLNPAAAVGTIILYLHYDGQPVDPTEWRFCGPFDPCLVTPAGTLELNEVSGRFDPEWRVYARSSSDDKGPIVALLYAVDALRATGRQPAWNLRVVLDGQEEGAPPPNHFRRFMADRGASLGADVAITLDGPRHPSGRPTIYHGVRGGVTVRLTVFTASGDLHSGNYGNWAPDPSIRLAHLLTSMKDEDGNILISGFHDDVIPLTPAEQEALEAIPNVEAALAETFGIAQPEQASERLEAKLNRPTLNVLAMESGGGLRGAVPAIPAWAGAAIQMRLVNGLDPAKQTDLMIEHVRRQGYHILTDRDPTDEERRRYPLLARMSANAGSRAARVPMEGRLSAVVTEALTVDGTPPVRLPTLGGSLPFSELSEGLGIPTVGVSLVNHDNNQHGPNENLRLGNLWQSIELLSRILVMPR